MSDLRLNVLTGEWVILAARRADRPHAGPAREPRPPQPLFSATCPFCPGNESETDLECERDPSGNGWRTRTVLNKYPALTPLDEPPSLRRRGLKVSVDAHGYHEVLIETPRHDQPPALMPLDQMAAVMRAYHGRYRVNAARPGVAHITLFKNHGETAGTSLLHPHSQLITSPVVPSQVRRRMSLFESHRAQGVSCLVCALIEDEHRDAARIIHDGAHFSAFIPFAALSGYHTWIMPKRHMPAFGDLDEPELLDLADTLRHVLRMVHFGLDDPDYNFVIRSAPIGVSDFHWYLAIVPRLARAAGFELGSGMYINAIDPDDAAEHLRRAPVPEG